MESYLQVDRLDKKLVNERLLGWRGRDPEQGVLRHGAPPQQQKTECHKNGHSKRKKRRPRTELAFN
jgi:hypothetical protein